MSAESPSTSDSPGIPPTEPEHPIVRKQDLRHRDVRNLLQKGLSAPEIEEVVKDLPHWRIQSSEKNPPETGEERRQRERRSRLRKIYRCIEKLGPSVAAASPAGSASGASREQGTPGGVGPPGNQSGPKDDGRMTHPSVDDLLLGFRRVDPALRPHLSPLQQAAVKDIEDALRRIAEKGGPEGEWVRKNRPDLFEEPTTPQPERRPGEAPAG